MKKAKKLTLQLYRVKWEDANSAAASWSAIENHTPKLLEVNSCGWLISEDRRTLVLAQNLSANGSAADTIHIPKNCITRKYKLGHSITYERQ